jgi:hypothetical protein
MTGNRKGRRYLGCMFTPTTFELRYITLKTNNEIANKFKALNIMILYFINGRFKKIKPIKKRIKKKYTDVGTSKSIQPKPQEPKTP